MVINNGSVEGNEEHIITKRDNDYRTSLPFYFVVTEPCCVGLLAYWGGESQLATASTTRAHGFTSSPVTQQALRGSGCILIYFWACTSCCAAAAVSGSHA
jgi:hypothetical protein